MRIDRVLVSESGGLVEVWSLGATRIARVPVVFGHLGVRDDAVWRTVDAVQLRGSLYARRAELLNHAAETAVWG